MENYLLLFSWTTKNFYTILLLNQIYNYNFEILDENYNGTSLNNLYIFDFNNNDNVAAYSNIKLYKFKIYNNNLVRDFIPFVRNRDNVVGLYDLVNNKFY